MNIYEIDPADLKKKVVKTTQSDKRKQKEPVQSDESVTETIVKKKKRKQKESVESVETVEQPVEQEPVAKKPKTEAQLAAIERRKTLAADKKKREEELKQMIATKEQELVDKKEAQKEKRRLAREAKKSTSSDSGKLVVESSNIDEPPAWFKKYVNGIKKTATQEAEPSQRKAVAKEITTQADERWKNESFKGKIQNEFINHHDRLKKMIFPHLN